MATFKKNMHRAHVVSKKKIKNMIWRYPKIYATPKYMEFIKAMIEQGWLVKLYVAKVSKYVFVIKNKQVFKIRFSNHKPLWFKEEEGDCDFYVGVSHKQCSTTEQIIERLNNLIPNRPRDERFNTRAFVGTIRKRVMELRLV